MILPELTTDQKNKINALFTQYQVEPAKDLYDIIEEDLNGWMGLINMLFDGDLEGDRKSIKRDNKRIKEIFNLVDEFENEGLKIDFSNALISFQPHLKHPYFLPAGNELNRFLVKSCNVIATVLTDQGYFKSSKDKGRLYMFLAALVNILRPGSFTSHDELTDGEIKAFQKFLFTNSPNPPPKRKLKP